MHRLLVTVFALLALSLLSAFAQEQATSPRPAANGKRVEQMSPEVRKARMKAILSSPEFADSQPTLFDRVRQYIGRKIAAAVKAIFGDAVESRNAVKAVSVGLAAVAMVLFVLLVAYVVARIGVRRMAARGASEDDDIYAGPETSNHALDEAERAARAGDYRSALRLMYLAMLLRLDDLELIRFDRTGTNWEYLSRLREHPEIHRMLHPITAAFDRKWYGREPADESDYRAFADACRAIESCEAAQ